MSKFKTKLIENIKTINLKDALVILVLLTIQVSIYFFTKPFLKDIQIIHGNIDNYIPFVPHFIWIYVSWYIMLVAYPYYIARTDKTAFFKYCVSYVICTVIATIIFILFPKTVTRAVVQNNDISSWLVRIIYAADTPGINCFPSLHCLLSFLFMFGAATAKKMTKSSKCFIILSSASVVLSTFFVKQHVVYDGILALIIVIFAWCIVDLFKLDNYFEKLYNKINFKKLRKC